MANSPTKNGIRGMPSHRYSLPQGVADEPGGLVEGPTRDSRIPTPPAIRPFSSEPWLTVAVVTSPNTTSQKISG